MTGFAGNMNWSKEIWEPATSGADLIRNHVEALTSLLAGLDPKAVEQAGRFSTKHAFAVIPFTVQATGQRRHSVAYRYRPVLGTSTPG